MPAAILRDSAPESRTTPMPDLPGGVEIATMVSSRFNEKQAQAGTTALQIYFFGRNERSRPAATIFVAVGVAQTSRPVLPLASLPTSRGLDSSSTQPGRPSRTILTRLRLAAQ
jgi:hypothetical protein